MMFLYVKVGVKLIHKYRKILDISNFFEMFYSKILLKSTIKYFSLQLFFVVSNTVQSVYLNFSLLCYLVLQ